jgi:DNA-binding MarR family transcriptional regulator
MDPLRHFGFLLKDVARLSTRNFERRAIADQLGLTIEQCRVLVYLEKNQGISQTRLAYLTETDPMTLMRILDRMEHNGWLERRRDPNDRRAWRLHLQPAARPILQRIWAIADAARDDALAGLNVAKVEQLLQLLEKVHGNLTALVPNASGVEHRHAATDALNAGVAKRSINAVARSRRKA